MPFADSTGPKACVYVESDYNIIWVMPMEYVPYQWYCSDSDVGDNKAWSFLDDIDSQGLSRLRFYIFVTDVWSDSTSMILCFLEIERETEKD